MQGYFRSHTCHTPLPAVPAVPAVQRELHELAGGHGPEFDLQEHLPQGTQAQQQQQLLQRQQGGDSCVTVGVVFTLGQTKQAKQNRARLALAEFV